MRNCIKFIVAVCIALRFTVVPTAGHADMQPESGNQNSDQMTADKADVSADSSIGCCCAENEADEEACWAEMELCQYDNTTTCAQIGTAASTNPSDRECICEWAVKESREVLGTWRREVYKPGDEEPTSHQEAELVRITKGLNVSYFLRVRHVSAFTEYPTWWVYEAKLNVGNGQDKTPVIATRHPKLTCSTYSWDFVIKDDASLKGRDYRGTKDGDFEVTVEEFDGKILSDRIFRIHVDPKAIEGKKYEDAIKDPALDLTRKPSFGSLEVQEPPLKKTEKSKTIFLGRPIR